MMNPFSNPNPLQGQRPDPTHGRGWADDGNPGRLTRRTERWAGWMERLSMRLNVLADGNHGFDQVPLTPQEQVEIEEYKTPDELEMEAAVYSPEAVIENRARLTSEAMRFQNGGG